MTEELMAEWPPHKRGQALSAKIQVIFLCFRNSFQQETCESPTVLMCRTDCQSVLRNYLNGSKAAPVRPAERPLQEPEWPTRCACAADGHVAGRVGNSGRSRGRASYAPWAPQVWDRVAGVISPSYECGEADATLNEDKFRAKRLSSTQPKLRII